MLKNKIFFIGLIFSFLISLNSYAKDFSKETNRVKATIITSKDEISFGESFDVLLKLEMKDGWHTYWKNPGEAGEETKVIWNLPKGYKSSYQNESFPITFITDNIYNYGFDNVAYFEYKITAKEEIKDIIENDIFFSANVSWLSCKDECVPENVKIDFPINLNKQDNFQSKTWKHEYDNAIKSFPKKEKWESSYKIISETPNEYLLVLNVETKTNIQKNKNIKFIPYKSNIIQDNISQYYEYDEYGNIILIISVFDKNFKNIEGIIYIDDYVFEIYPQYKENIKIPNFRDEEKITPKQSKQIDYKYFSMILIMAFLGGLILNLMPCILPIITIKAISLIQSNQKPKESKIEAIVYFAGVVISFLSIATILAILRIDGSKIGWGFQLQSPSFIILMIVIFAIIFLMMLDLIIIKNPFAKVGRISFERKRINSFFTGLISVLIASPCSAPFMGVALGYTLSKPIYIYYSVFIMLSIGYALPFTLIGFYPKVIHKILPKPGKWMINLKKILSIPILLTCLWLSWILYNQINYKNLNDFNWNEYNEKEIAEEIKNGNSVFIDFTAKWCITCLTNKKMVIETDFFKELSIKKNIKLYRADWTTRNENITIALEKYGRNSVPLYVYYNKDNKEHIILPQILSKSIIEKYLK